MQYSYVHAHAALARAGLAYGGFFDLALSYNLTAHTMDDRKKRALRQCHSDLRTGITVTHFLPKLHIDAGGFLSDVEFSEISDKNDNVKQVDILVDVLLKKENEDFDYFCDVLEKEGYRSCSNKLKVALRKRRT